MKEDILYLLSVLLLMQLRILLASLAACQRYHWLMFNLVSTDIHRSFFHRVLPQPVQLKGVPPCQVLDLLFVLCLVRFLSAHSSSLPRPIQRVALSLSILFCSLGLPPVWLPPAMFNSNHSTASFRSLIKMLNGTYSMAVLCGIAVVSGIQAGRFVVLLQTHSTQ